MSAAEGSIRQQPAKEAAENILNLQAVDKITGCFGLWTVSDRILEELGKCSACRCDTSRVLTITSVERLERRIPLCEQHYLEAVHQHPEIERMSDSASS